MRADGNANGVIDAGDYAICADAGRRGAGASLAIPEPSSIGLVIAVIGGLMLHQRGVRRIH